MLIRNTVPHIFNRIHIEDIEALLDADPDVAITMTMPTERAGRNIRKNPIRFKNLLREAEKQLEERGYSKPDIADITDPAYDLLDDRDFWQEQSDGFALYLSEGIIRSFRLPVRFDNFVMVSDRFHIKPLIPLLTGDGHFYVLTLSQEDVRLMHGTRFNIDDMELNDDIPESLLEMIAKQDIQGWRQVHFRNVVQGSAEGNRGEGATGHSVSYVVEEEKEKRILEFFRQVDDGVYDVLHQEQAPLVLIGPHQLQDLYRKANTYNHLLDEGVDTHPNQMDSSDIHDAAWKLVEPMFREKQEEAENAFHARVSGETASDDLRDIVRAAHFGRIDTLFVATDERRWGTFKEQNATVDFHEERTPDSTDLLDFAAVRTMEQGGVVYALPADDVPGEGPAAALFRY
jgi:hypothetical protein